MSASYEDIEDQLPPDTLPALMSFPRTAKDVSEIVKFANDNGMKVSIKNSGHSWTAGSSSRDSLLRSIYGSSPSIPLRIFTSVMKEKNIHLCLNRIVLVN